MKRLLARICAVAVAVIVAVNSGAVVALALSPDETWLAVGTDRGIVLVYDLGAEGLSKIN